MSTSRKDDPYLGFRFQVEVDSLRVAGFSEVSGLEIEMEPEEYREGGVNSYTHKLPTHFDHPNVLLERGITDYQGLWLWIQDVRDGNVTRKNVTVILYDSAGEESWGWECREAYPVRWAGPELRADQGNVAIETLELAHKGVSRMEGLPSR